VNEAKDFDPVEFVSAFEEVEFDGDGEFRALRVGLGS
jgi:hypothetical protein